MAQRLPEALRGQPRVGRLPRGVRPQRHRTRPDPIRAMVRLASARAWPPASSDDTRPERRRPSARKFRSDDPSRHEEPEARDIGPVLGHQLPELAEQRQRGRGDEHQDKPDEAEGDQWRPPPREETTAARSATPGTSNHPDVPEERIGYTGDDRLADRYEQQADVTQERVRVRQDGWLRASPACGCSIARNSQNLAAGSDRHEGQQRRVQPPEPCSLGDGRQGRAADRRPGARTAPSPPSPSSRVPARRPPGRRPSSLAALPARAGRNGIGLERAPKCVKATSRMNIPQSSSDRIATNPTASVSAGCTASNAAAVKAVRLGPGLQSSGFFERVRDLARRGAM